MRATRFLLLAGLAFLLAGCFQYQEELELAKDGSGSVHMHYAIDKALIQQMEAMAESFGSTGEDADSKDPREMFDRARVERRLAETGAKVKLLDYSATEDDQSLRWNLGFEFARAKDMAAIGYALSDDEDEVWDPEKATASKDEMPVFEKQSDGTWLFTRLLDEGGDSSDGAGGGPTGGDTVGDMSEAMNMSGPQGSGETGESGDEDAPSMEEMQEAMRQMTAMMESGDDASEEAGESAKDEEGAEGEGQDMAAAMEQFGESMEALQSAMTGMAEGMQSGEGEPALRFSVKFPGEILESNATRVEGRTAIWEFTLQQMMGPSPKLSARVKG